jgi:cell division initiation protein
MRITPLEIRQKTFEKNFRGYEKDEVHAFLMTLSQEWERMQDEIKELRYKLEATEREVGKLREVESSLYKTLKTAEDTGASVIDQARKAAELHLKESQLKADAMLNEAKTKARDTIEESEGRAKEIVEDMEDRLKSLIENYKKLETSREDLIADLKRLGSDLLDRVDRATNSTRDFNPDKHLSAVKRETRKIAFPNHEFEKTARHEQIVREDLKLKNIEDPAQEPVSVEAEQSNSRAFIPESEPVLKRPQKSFFDEIN